ncbi:MAG: polysaccharide deacetylase family protein [Gemmatimonadetes bacterium]|nr:polysaccharide deacetylase family protein [Gemmatimonadota bacterium]
MNDARPMPPYVRTVSFGLLATTIIAVMITAMIGAFRPPPPVAHETKAAMVPLRQDGRRVAVTFDDLPALAQGDRSVATYERITDRLLRSLAEHRVPAIGFVNEQKLLTDGRVDPRRVATLRRWVDAGLELGNHAYSHPDFHATPVDAYITDVARGDSVTRLVMQAAGRQPRFFRHPFLRTGRTLQDRRRFETFLAEQEYRVAPVTLDNSDYLFAAAYDLAPDDETRARVADEYVRYMEAVTAYWERQSVALFGREIPQVLLLHANNINADHFGRLAQMYRRRGYAFVPLEQAMEDPAYASEDTYTGPRGPSWIHRWALTRGTPAASLAGEPAVPGWVQALSRRRRN